MVMRVINMKRKKILLSTSGGIDVMYYVVLIFSLFLGITPGCTKASNDNDPDITTTRYSEDQTNFSNPERGFLSQQASYSDSPSPFSKAFFDGLKSSKITLVRKSICIQYFPFSSDLGGIYQAYTG